MTIVGEIHYLVSNDTIIRFEWRVPKISALGETEETYYYHSPDIRIVDVRWNLKLCKAEKDLIGLYVRGSNSYRPLKLAVGIRWDGDNEQIVDLDRTICVGNSSFSIKFPRKWCLMSTLTASFTLWDEPTYIQVVSREVQTEEDTNDIEDTMRDVSTLQKHLQHLLHNGDGHDITIKVGDQEFRAHKNMLQARSPVFSAMFKHKMKESADGTISIEDCDPDTFADFLKYVYTGRVEHLSSSKAIGLYSTADKYDFSALKETCVKFLKDSLSTAVICSVIALAMKHGENDLLECAMTFFSENAKQILTTVEWQHFVKDNFIVANELYIKLLDYIQKKRK